MLDTLLDESITACEEPHGDHWAQTRAAKVAPLFVHGSFAA
jgi:hypothetical protein